MKKSKPRNYIKELIQRMKKSEARYYIKELIRAIKNSIALEIIWNILIFIPKMIFRLLKNLW
ncbi:hypothetical protein B1B04_15385 [Lysinibacillus sp. KCTC 33748]|nr:hypothetical protein B1B04_15385 [Lysinibacillus sp. KCTC 33748]